MESPDRPQTQLRRIRDTFHLNGAERMRWLQAKERIAAEMRAVVYEVTGKIGRQLPDEFSQWARDVRTRRSAGDGYMRFVEMVARNGHTLTRDECWQYAERMLTLERKAAELAFGLPSEPGPGGRTPDDLPATQPETQVRDIRGVTLGSCDALGWHEWKPAA